MAISIFLSHTTQDPRDHKLAERLAVGLKSRKVDVWIAPDSIPAGERWKGEIVDGVMKKCTHFLIIFSAASSRAKWVIEELRMAQRRARVDPSFKVLPLVIGDVEKLPNARFLKTLQWVPFREEFHAQLDAVAEALGLQPIAPESVRTLVEERTRDFVGREFVFDAIDKFSKSQPNGYFVVQGEPGIGKSAIVASFVKRTGCVAHFNVRAQGITTPRQFLQNICIQLIRRYGLPYASLPQGTTDDGTVLAQLLYEAKDRLEPNERLLVAVDALDEADVVRPDSNVLYLPSDLPDRVYFLVSKRPAAVALNAVAPRELMDLSLYREECMKDVRRYITLQVEVRKTLAAWIEAHQSTRAAFVENLAQKSNGNFMYLRYVLPDIERNRYDALSFDKLPSGLEDYYEDHWRRMGMTAKPSPREKIRIVYLLSTVQRPVSRKLLSQFATDARISIDEITVQEVLDEWDPFLRKDKRDGATTYSIYHASFRDFLHRKDIVQAAGVSLEGLQQQIADDLWRNLFDE
jgi:hypothetical protein